MVAQRFPHLLIFSTRMSHPLSFFAHKRAPRIILSAAMLAAVLTGEAALAAPTFSGGAPSVAVNKTNLVTLSPLTITCNAAGDFTTSTDIQLMLTPLGAAPVKYDTTATVTASATGVWTNRVSTSPEVYNTGMIQFRVDLSCAQGDKVVISGIRVMANTMDFEGSATIETISSSGDYSVSAIQVDTKSPTATKAAYYDTNNDAAVDEIKVTFSEPMNASFAANEWTLTPDAGTLGNTAFIQSMSATSGSGTAVTELALGVSATAGKTAGGFSLAYSDKDGNPLTDAAGNRLTSFSFATIEDRATPKPTYAAIQDMDVDGRIDRIAISYSEPLVTSNLTTADWAISSASTYGGSFVLTGISASASKITLTFNEPGVERTYVGDLTVSYLGGASSIKAAQGTLVNALNGVTIKASGGTYNVLQDEANPVVLSVKPINASTGVLLTTPIEITFSEDMTVGSLSVTVIPSIGALVQETGGFGVVKLTHATAFAPNTTYSITVNSGQAKEGASASDKLVAALPYAWFFTTGSSQDFAPTISINSGASQTSSQETTLTLSAQGANQMMITNGTDFTGKSWESYAASKSWTTASGSGAKTVCVKFRNTATGLESQSACDSIELSVAAKPVAISFKINADASTTASPVVTLFLKADNATKVQIADNAAFTGAQWEPYSQNKEWVLSGTSGVKTLYVEFGNDAGDISTVLSDSITLDLAATGPVGISISLNGGAATTASNVVTANLSANNAQDVRLSEDPTFAGASWETFASAKSFALSGGFGPKTVYAQFRTASGVASKLVSDSITYASSTPPPPPGPISLSPGDLIKMQCPAGADVNHPCTAVYYYGYDGKRHAYLNSKLYHTWYADFSAVKTIPETQMAAITLGGNVTVRPGTLLIKITSLPRVYAIEPGGVRRWVPSESAAYILYGADWAKKVMDISELLFLEYPEGPALLNSSADLLDDDKDGVSNMEEALWGSNKLSKDSDGDGTGDAKEIGTGYNPFGTGTLAAKFGSSLEAKYSTYTHPTGALIRYTGSTQYWYMDAGARRAVGSSAFGTNNLQTSYAVTVQEGVSKSEGLMPLTSSEDAVRSPMVKMGGTLVKL